jgi:ferrous iron transport protein A
LAQPQTGIAERSARLYNANNSRLQTIMPNQVPASLALASIGDALFVHSVSAPGHAPEWAAWLEEIGFLPGEPVCVMARGLPGADPLVVRIGESTFALRRAEAQCIMVGRAEPEAVAVRRIEVAA